MEVFLCISATAVTQCEVLNLGGSPPCKAIQQWCFFSRWCINARVYAEGGESTAVEALLRFDSKVAALVLEEEVREAFFGSISSAIGQPLPAPTCF